MDSLKSLLDDKKYELVIKLTKGSKNSADLFYRIAAFMCLGNYEEALYVIQDNQEILNDNLVALIPIHIELLCALDRFEQAYAVSEYYSNLPYQSQEVEEVIQKVPALIEQARKRNEAVYYSEDEIIEKLTSTNNEEVIFALDLIKKRDVLFFLPYIKNVLVKFPNQTVRSLALMLLVEKEVDRELQYLQEGKIINVNPKKLKAPFTGPIFNGLAKRFSLNLKDPSLTNYATNILASYVIYTYPREIEESESEELFVAIYLSAKKMLGIDDLDIQQTCLEHQVDVNRVNFYINKIDLVLRDI